MELFVPTGLEQIFHILYTQTVLAVLPCAFCSLYAWGNSSVCLPCDTLAKGGGKSGENM